MSLSNLKPKVKNSRIIQIVLAHDKLIFKGKCKDTFAC